MYVIEVFLLWVLWGGILWLYGVLWGFWGLGGGYVDLWLYVVGIVGVGG